MSRLEGEIGAVIAEQVSGRGNDEQRIMFIGAGIALGDLITAKLLFQKAAKERVGTWIDFYI